jgi:hypothetical protein
MEGELDLLAGLLLERGNDLPERHILLGMEALIPPDDEVGGPGAGQRQHERGGEEDGPSQHGTAP